LSAEERRVCRNVEHARYRRRSSASEALIFCVGTRWIS
jgi:hypothetical protein